MTTKARNIRVPFIARQYFRKYSPILRQRIYEIIAERQKVSGKEVTTWDDVWEVAKAALTEFETLAEPQLYPDRDARAREAFRKGRCRTTREIVDGLRASMA